MLSLLLTFSILYHMSMTTSRFTVTSSAAAQLIFAAHEIMINSSSNMPSAPYLKRILKIRFLSISYFLLHPINNTMPPNSNLSNRKKLVCLFKKPNQSMHIARSYSAYSTWNKVIMRMTVQPKSEQKVTKVVYVVRLSFVIFGWWFKS